MSNAVCAACKHPIDAAAKVCPYCGANPETGEKIIDTQAVLQEVFKPRHVSTGESIVEFARQRQGIVIAIGVIVVFLIFTFLHQFVTARNARTSNSPAVALTDIADLSNQPEENKQQPLPELQFQTDGRPQVMQTFIAEQGAVTPPEVIAAQQAAAQPQQQQPGQPQQNPATPPAQPQPQPPAASQQQSQQ
jgi:hypothetical protein